MSAAPPRSGADGDTQVMARPAPRFAATPAQLSELTQPGADSSDLLRELGYDEEQQAALHAAGAIA